MVVVVSTTVVVVLAEVDESTGSAGATDDGVMLEVALSAVDSTGAVEAHPASTLAQSAAMAVPS